MTPVKYLCQILVFLGLTLSVWGDEILFSDSTDYNPIQASGNWSSPEVWDGGIILGTSPADSELDIVIPYGTKLILDTDVELGTITVHGTLAIANTTVHLICDSLIIEGVGAELEIGTEAERYSGDFTLTLKGDTTEEHFAHGGHNMGARALLAYNGGTLNIHGADVVAWTRLGANALPGNTSITMSEPVDWQANDVIVITSSDLSWTHAEQRTIASVSPDGLTVNLTQSLDYKHTGVIQEYTRSTDGKTWTADLRAEVGLLTRNVTIQGASDCVDTDHANYGLGGHIMVHGPIEMGGLEFPTGAAFIEGVELFRMGQKSRLARYPFHWHLCLDSRIDGKQQYFSDSSVHISFNRAITIHGTNYAVVENNFCYDHLGHGLFLEDGSERFNIIRKNVVLHTRRPLRGEEVTPSDNSHNEVQNRTPASFWITNPNNIFEDNVAAGTPGTGYWFIFPNDPLEPSRSHPYFSGLKPIREPLGSFKGNSAHSCMSAVDIFDRLSTNHGITPNVGWYNDTIHLMEDCTWYSNTLALYSGIGRPKDRNLVFENNVFVDNREAIMFASYSVVNESVIVADSGEGLITGQRKLFRLYDGAGSVTNSHFVGFDQSNANLLENTGAATKHVNTIFDGNTLDHPGTPRASLPNYDLPPVQNTGANGPTHPRMWSAVVKDVDGGVSGKADTSIISNHRFIRVGDEYRPPNWTNVYRSDRDYILAIQIASGTPKATITRSRPGTPDASVYYIDGFHHHTQLPLIVNDGFLYTYQFQSLPNNQRVRMIFDDGNPGDSVMTRFKEFGKLGGLNVNGKSGVNYTSLSSIAAVENSQVPAYYIEPNGDLYVRMFFDGLSEFELVWSQSIAVETIDTDGDGMSDIDEINSQRHAFDARDLKMDFNSNGDFEGWNSFSQITNPTVSGGTLRGTSTGDSKITHGDLNVRAAEIGSLIVRIKSDINANVRLFWSRDNASGFASSRSANAAYSGNGDWQEVMIPLAQNSEWHSTINALRLDPIDDGNGNFEIDWIGAVPPFDATELAPDFETDRDFEGWDDFFNIINPIVAFGTLRGTATGASRIRNDDLNLNAASIGGLTLRIKTSVNTSIRLFWSRDDAPGYSGTRGVVGSYNGNGAWQAVTLPLSQHSEWRGTITGIRIDPVNTSGDFEIDWIRLSASAETQTAPTYPLVVNNGQSNGDFHEWELVTIEADQAPAGMVFDSWGGDTANVADPQSRTTTLIKGAAATNIYAQYQGTPEGRGALQASFWYGIGGDSTVSSLTELAEYPDAPDETFALNSFQIPSPWGSHYGARVHGILYPPITGDYTLWIASDGQSELWLSSDASASNLSMIAKVPSGVAPLSWTEHPQQQSSTVNLVANQPYFIEARFKASQNPDHLAVAWQGPGISQSVLSGSNVTPQAPIPSASVTVRGTPHSWLDYHGLVMNDDFENIDLLDVDGDGFSAFDEFTWGTNPNDASSRPQPRIENDIHGEMHFVFDSSFARGAGYGGLQRFYTIYTSSHLTRWDSVSGHTAQNATNGEVTFPVPAVPSGRQFFRVQIWLEDE